MTLFHSVNGKITGPDETMISALDMGLLRGYGVFDYAQLYQGHPFHLREHIERLKWSAEQMELTLPFSIDEIEQNAWRVIEKNDPIDAGLRFVVTAGLSAKDQVMPISSATLIILFHPFTPYPQRVYESGMRVITTNTLRIYPSVKSTNYLPAVFAVRKAMQIGYDDALFVSPGGGLLEGTTCNVFFFKKDTLITDDSDQIVKGVTRKIILELARDHFQIDYRPLSLDEVTECEEAFLTSSIKDVIPLVQVDEWRVGQGVPGKKTEFLRGLYHDYIREYLSKVS